MAGWRDSGSQTGSRTTPSDGFLCGFNIVGRLGPLNEVGQAMGLCGGILSSGSGPKKPWYPQILL